MKHIDSEQQGNASTLKREQNSKHRRNCFETVVLKT